MSRFGFVVLLILATQAGCGSTPLPPSPMPSPLVRTQPPVPPVPVQPAPAPSPPPDADVVVTPLQPPKIVTPTPFAKDTYIALLLPTKSRDFSRAAEMVLEGFEAAAAQQTTNPIPVKVFSLENEGDALLEAYRQAVTSGGRCVVAGLTRDGAGAVATSGMIMIPTLTLNQVDVRSFPSGSPFYTFSLSIEDEARQMAQLIADQGLSRVAILEGSSALSKRIRSAFEQAWTGKGSDIVARLQVTGPADYGKLRPALQTADAIFIAGESGFARQIMPFIARSTPIFATSQVYDGSTRPGANVDLQGIRFLEMPWMVDPAHAAVAVYPRSNKAAGADLDRLYALGIDAYRLAYILATTATPGAGWLDGVTGEITLRDGHRFQRDLVPAYMDDGHAVPLK